MDTPHPKRAFIMQILRLTVWIIIAVALIKFSFFPSQKSEEEQFPGGNFEPPTVEVVRDTIQNDTSFDATVLRAPAQAVKATANGKISRIYVNEGARVGAGAPLYQIRSEEIQESDDPEEGPTTRVTYTKVTAPANGTLHLDVLLHQEVSIGMETGSITPDVFYAQMPITPEKLYAVDSLPKEGMLSIKDGPAPFPCTNLRSVTTTIKSPENTGSASVNPELHCDIPADQRVFDGLKAKLVLTGSKAENVLVVPVSAVEGRFREGVVYIPAEDAATQEAQQAPAEGEQQPAQEGQLDAQQQDAQQQAQSAEGQQQADQQQAEQQKADNAAKDKAKAKGKKAKPQPVKVELGISDGKMIEIKSGLNEGQRILQYVPGKPQENKRNGMPFGFGG